MVYLAFYKGSGRFLDRLIRCSTGSKYSHVELLPNPNVEAISSGDAFVAEAWSASGRDGGVRSKSITFHPDRWDFVAVGWAPLNSPYRIAREVGKKYDFVGAVSVPFAFAKRQSDSRWFCSEICAAALGIAEPHMYSPGALKLLVQEMNSVAA